MYIIRLPCSGSRNQVIQYCQKGIIPDFSSFKKSSSHNCFWMNLESIKIMVFLSSFWGITLKANNRSQWKGFTLRHVSRWAEAINTITEYHNCAKEVKPASLETENKQKPCIIRTGGLKTKYQNTKMWGITTQVSFSSSSEPFKFLVTMSSSYFQNLSNDSCFLFWKP